MNNARRGWFAILWLVASWLGSSVAAHGQVSFVTPAPPSVTPELPGVLERGQKLETQRRWGEALTLYEEALRNHPHQAALEQRFSTARAHYDLARRYSDNSFRQSLGTMALQDALDLYSEVLLKIQSHYVSAPDWNYLLDHGTANLEVAMDDPSFAEQNLAGQSAARIDRFHRTLRMRMQSRPAAEVNSRHTVRQAVADIAALARAELGIREVATVMEYVCGATNSLDSYSTFLTAGQLGEVYSQIEGNFVGLGVELKASEGSLLIVKVITGSPAERSSILAGDRIVAVEGRTTDELSTDQAANMLQGKEGTTVRVTAVTPGQAPRNLLVRREQVEVPSIDDARILDRGYGIAYAKLTCFQKTTSRDLDAALWRLHREGMKSLILDLRGNPGGLLTTSVEVVDKFVSRGVIVSTKGRSPQEDFVYSAHEPGTWHVPLVVLIDGESASASEIFAGAIRDHRRGTIVGTRSYGKGSVQGIFPLNTAGSGLRLTTAKFYSPNGQPYSLVGVQPDVLVQQAARPIDGENEGAANLATNGDPALDAATEAAKRQIARR
ncbi:MAG TPA: S41 family peptidase [Pirellulales bacterium]|jgi:carboxyl-terminal processing protease|nr:S41 family peptidase [Pirellulales bacterium]